MAGDLVEIIGESVKAGVGVALIKAFPGVGVYLEQTTEPEFPHFSIEQLTVGAKEERKNRWWLDYLITVRYREAADTALVGGLRQKLDKVGLEMLARLLTIDLGKYAIPFRDPRTEKSDGVLFYFCNFRFQATKGLADALKQERLALDRRIN